MILEKIEKKAEEVLASFGAKTVPVPIEDIASKLGIKISRAPSGEFSGILIRKDGAALVGVNSEEPATRQRFTIAHELGHYYLHPQKETFIDYRDNKRPTKPIAREQEADMFAAALLMPREDVKRDFRTFAKTGFTEESLSGLAANYQVSELAMKLRIWNLGQELREQ